MRPPPTRNGAPPQGPAARISHRQAPDHPQGTSAPATVHVAERRVTADVQLPDAAADALLRRTVAAHRRERRGARSWMVYGSQLVRLVTALESAGYRVERIEADR